MTNPLTKWRSILRERDWHLGVAVIAVLVTLRGAGFLLPSAWNSSAYLPLVVFDLPISAMVILLGMGLVALGQWALDAAYSNRPRSASYAMVWISAIYAFQAYSVAAEAPPRPTYVLGSLAMSLVCSSLALRCRTETGRR